MREKRKQIFSATRHFAKIACLTLAVWFTLIPLAGCSSESVGHRVSKEEWQSAAEQYIEEGNEIVYWRPGYTVTHTDPFCSRLAYASDLCFGTPEEAAEAGCLTTCSSCS